ncbi:putative quinol monooxygenase [Aquisalinus flavus]|uniref:ABM domain-containing protein n=1 Tax=Aquisalinus flavus TaxID=1526572 RepID=A0A8J2V4F0_9PROT|nr:putative quinol monooxygenase [Aquisalinus flavus]MBD0426464.1 antibiotic biosynthesis monooxygenase [Aquisalinus flavus]UNE47982.1 antibiotic biosynthesis monooxygenase [Aquisalinus flavus]GGD07711.1 hypothetical protein GCM10011342_15720 [Aquisalinus flavus]
MIIVTGTVTVASADALTALEGAMKKQIAASRSEKGCIEYIYGIDVVEPHKFRVLEYWESWEALEAHGNAPHLEAWHAALDAAGVTGRELIATEPAKLKNL